MKLNQKLLQVPNKTMKAIVKSLALSQLALTP